MKNRNRIQSFTWRTIAGTVALLGAMAVEYFWSDNPSNVLIGIFTLTGCVTGAFITLSVGSVVQDLRDYE